MRAKPRPLHESTAARTDDVVFLFQIDRTYNGLSTRRVAMYAPTVSSKASLIDWEIKRISLCFLPIATFHERCTCVSVHDGRVWTRALFFATVSGYLQDHTAKVLSNRDARDGCDPRFCLPWDAQRVVFNHWMQAVLRIRFLAWSAFTRCFLCSSRIWVLGYDRPEGGMESTLHCSVKNIHPASSSSVLNTVNCILISIFCYKLQKQHSNAFSGGQTKLSWKTIKWNSEHFMLFLLYNPFRNFFRSTNSTFEVRQQRVTNPHLI